MPKYIIEREMPKIGRLTEAELQRATQQTVDAIYQLGPQIQWVQSYVTDNKLYCVYIAPNPEIIRQHAELSGLPANRISSINTSIDPTTAEVCRDT